MRRIRRIDLTAATQASLDVRQGKVDTEKAVGILDVEKTWKKARKTKPLKTVLNKLKSMAGPRERCMYCEDSHGTDIEHFWPKTPYPERMFRWPNLLLCCTECGRFKGERFPLANGAPLLIDPTTDDPWLDLDFDPVTGNLTPRFDLATGAWSPRGEKTVEHLQLDRREAMNKGYLKTWRRLRSKVEAAMQNGVPDPVKLEENLREADDHGLLGWCFTGTGQNVEPFTSLRRDYPAVWATFLQTFVEP